MKTRQIRTLLGFTVLVLSFQNCNSPKSSDQSNSTPKDDKATGSTTLASGGSNTNQSSGAAGIKSGRARGISSGSSSGAGFTGISGGSTGNPGGGSGTSGGCIGCNSGGSGSSGGTGGSGGAGSVPGPGGGEVAYKITTQPLSKTIAEGTEFFVGVSIQGGRSPFTFKWYRNGEEIPPVYGTVHYETYSGVLDRVYKEGDYHVVVSDASGAKLTSNKAQIRMIAKPCQQGNYFIDLLVRTNSSDGYSYFNDLFYYKNKKYLVSQHNSTVSMMQLNALVNNLSIINFGYFTLGGSASNNQSFSIECSTDVPTIHTSVCATNNLNKCPYHYENGHSATQTYEGSINFVCRNGSIEFISNTCRLVAPPSNNTAPVCYGDGC